MSETSKKSSIGYFVIFGLLVVAIFLGINWSVNGPALKGDLPGNDWIPKPSKGWCCQKKGTKCEAITGNIPCEHFYEPDVNGGKERCNSLCDGSFFSSKRSSVASSACANAGQVCNWRRVINSNNTVTYTNDCCTQGATCLGNLTGSSGQGTCSN